MVAVLIIGAAVLVAILAVAIVFSPGQDGTNTEGPDVPYTPIADIEAQTIADKSAEVVQEAAEPLVEAVETTPAAVQAAVNEATAMGKKKTTSIMGQVKRSRSVKQISKAMSSMMK